MNNLHEIYYGYSETTLMEMQKTCTYVIDTNVLFDLYRVSSDSRAAILKILKSYRDRIWFPYQVVDEYYKNRLNVINETLSRYSTLKSSVNRLKNEIKSNLRELDSKIENHLDILSNMLDDLQKRDIVVLDFKTDPILDELYPLFLGRTGEAFLETDLIELYKEADSRYELKIPPGYSDIKKNDDGKYGDFLIWEQITAFASKIPNDIIFITGDTKEDWILESKGKKCGPRHELRKEFIDKTEQKFHIYSLEKFVKLADSSVSPQILSDIVHSQTSSSSSWSSLLEAATASASALAAAAVWTWSRTSDTLNVDVLGFNQLLELFQTYLKNNISNLNYDILNNFYNAISQKLDENATTVLSEYENTQLIKKADSILLLFENTNFSNFKRTPEGYEVLIDLKYVINEIVNLMFIIKANHTVIDN